MKNIDNLNSIERFKSSPRHQIGNLLSSLILFNPLISCWFHLICNFFAQFIQSIRTDKRGRKRNAVATQILAFILLFSILTPTVNAAGCWRGFAAFVGIGYDFGPRQYSQTAYENDGDPYRTPVQAIAGIEYNNSIFNISGLCYRIQYQHSSDTSNQGRQSFGDLNMPNMQLVWRF